MFELTSKQNKLSSWIPLNSNEHGNMVFTGCENCTQVCCAGLFNNATVGAYELVDVAKFFPVVFNITSDGKLRMALLYSIKKGVPCAYWDKNKKQCTIYDRIRPNTCTTYPFNINFLENNEARISFHSRCRGLKESVPGVKIIAENGQPSDEIVSVFLKNETNTIHRQKSRETVEFLKMVSGLDLLAEEKIAIGKRVKPYWGEQIFILSVLKINEKKLAALDPDVISELNTSGYADFINAHLKSLSHLPMLYEKMADIEKCSSQNIDMSNYTFGG